MTALLTMKDREYTALVKSLLRDDVGWKALVTPSLMEKTRATLVHMLVSIDSQIERYTQEKVADPKWLVSITALRRFVAARYEALPPSVPEMTTESNKTRAWRSFSAKLAMALEEGDTDALDTLRTPFGGVTARVWLTKQKEMAS